MTSIAAGSAIASNLAAVQRRAAAACERAGRDPKSVTLIGVTKTRPVEDLLEAHAAGLRHFGENYVQEGAAKVLEAREQLEGGFIAHFIGNLQRNKVRAAIEAFDIIHSVDSERLIEALAGGADEGKRVGVFVQVNLAGEANKRGVAPAELGPLLTSARRHSAELDLLGLMTVPPAGTAEEARPWFRQLRTLARDNGLECLSMGMTGDFEVAIEEGATHIRVGQAIFGARP